ncbi:MAG: hypothetical protein ACJ76P_06065 [Actinomycetota bacterium]
MLALFLLVLAAGLYLYGALHVLDLLYAEHDRDRVTYLALEILPVALLWVASGAAAVWKPARPFAAGVVVGIAVYIAAGTLGGMVLDDVTGMHGPELAGSLVALVAGAVILSSARGDSARRKAGPNA